MNRSAKIILTKNFRFKSDCWKNSVIYFGMVAGLNGASSDSNGQYADATADIFDGYRTTYNVSAVIDSRSGRAIKEMADTLYIRWASEDDIKAKRHRATVTCDLSLPTTDWTLDSGNGRVGVTSSPTPASNNVDRLSCRRRPCLFNIESDPCERNNVAASYPTIVARLYDMLRYYGKLLVPQITQPVDPFRADPKLWNYTWSPWVG